jgi:predicted NAD/FAD-dependent oxidoreductase
MRIVIVGAGMAGLAAARNLSPDDHDLVLLDKGRSPGGRLATRRIGPATIDHGAQFFTIRTPEFHQEIVTLLADGTINEWCRGFGMSDGHPRYVVEGGMNRLAKYLARDLDIRCDALAFAVRPTDAGGWSVALDDGTEIPADAVVLTCPIPQSWALLATSGVELPAELLATEYDRILGLLLTLDQDPGLAPPGGIQRPDDTFGFIADNRAKGISAVPALTFHATATVSDEWWDRPPVETEAHLLAAARPWLGAAGVLECQLKRWRFAMPRQLWPEPCWHRTEPAPLVLAGDAFAGPWVAETGVARSNLEGAYLSGRAAAAVLTALGG